MCTAACHCMRKPAAPQSPYAACAGPMELALKHPAWLTCLLAARGAGCALPAARYLLAVCCIELGKQQEAEAALLQDGLANVSSVLACLAASGAQQQGLYCARATRVGKQLCRMWGGD